jgi:hypothetical protein
MPSIGVRCCTELGPGGHTQDPPAGRDVYEPIEDEGEPLRSTPARLVVETGTPTDRKTVAGHRLGFRDGVSMNDPWVLAVIGKWA